MLRSVAPLFVAAGRQSTWTVGARASLYGLVKLFLLAAGQAVALYDAPQLKKLAVQVAPVLMEMQSVVETVP